MAAVAFLTNTQIGSTRYPLWVLFLGLGTIAAMGGTAAVLSDDDASDFLEDALASGEYVAVPRTELARLKRSAGVPSISTDAPLIGPFHPAEVTALRNRMPDDPSPAGRAGTRTGDAGLTDPESWRVLERESAPWEERETDEEDPASSGIPSVRPTRTTEDEVVTLLDELERNIALRTGTPQDADASRVSDRPAPPPDGPDETWEPDPDPDGRTRRRERSMPTTTPDPADAWIDRASLPQEFSRLLSEMYPPESPARPVAPAVALRRRRTVASGRCTSCGGRLMSSTGECSVCHVPLCRMCAGLLSLTSERPVCDRCAAGGARGRGGPAGRGRPKPPAA